MESPTTPAKLVDDVRVSDVLLLRCRRQRQVIANQPRDELRFVLAHPVLQAERLGVYGAEFGVITAATFGNVVKQPRKIRDLGFFDRLHNAAAVWVLVIESTQRENA